MTLGGLVENASGKPVFHADDIDDEKRQEKDAEQKYKYRIELMRHRFLTGEYSMRSFLHLLLTGDAKGADKIVVQRN